MENIIANEDSTTIIPLVNNNPFISKESVDKCTKIARLNALNKNLFNNCCNISCPIYNNTVSKSIFSGSCDASTMLVDAFPSEYESFTGCFTDEKGFLLEEILNSIGIHRSDIYCTTVIKCYDIAHTNTDIINNCLKHYFYNEIEIIKPKKLVVTYSAYQAILKYGLIPFVGTINYFSKKHITLSNNLETDLYVIYDFKDCQTLTEQQINAFTEGLKIVLH